ncbi:unnamed protein product [Meloidogyne enterolobii]|uniref:Uncharacterized protein n=1 Tax=Meloidogyne enterolobii TaxID=390850 RepID=A0ACB1AMJ3_MELEN
MFFVRDPQNLWLNRKIYSIDLWDLMLMLLGVKKSYIEMRHMLGGGTVRESKFTETREPRTEN